MNRHFAIAGIIISLLITGCSIDDENQPDHFLIYEKAGEQIEVKMSWKINGIPDEGLLADMMLYISRSKDMSDASLSESLGNLTISYPDFYGNHEIIPSDRYLFHAYRFYVGAAFHGLRPGAQQSFPLKIDFQIQVVNSETGETIETMENRLTIEEEDVAKTNILYTYTLDVIENEPETAYRNYSFREMKEPLRITRESDVVHTTTFSAEKNLYADLTWKVNGETQGYSAIDLDLFLHDTNNSNIANFSDMDDYSATENSYEGIRIEPENNYFQDGAPQKLGFYFFDKLTSDSPVTVEYIFTLYSIDGKIKRYVLPGSFNSPPVQDDQGTFYFYIKITRNNGTYTADPLAEPLVWTP